MRPTNVRRMILHYSVKCSNVLLHSCSCTLTNYLLSSISAVVLASVVAVAPSEAAATNVSHAPFGTITSKPGECVVGDPNTYISPSDLQWIWDNRLKHDATTYDNWIIDDLVANKGIITYCIRWDSNTTVLAKEIAAKFQPMLTRQHAAWNRWLVGYDCCPFDEITVNVVGFAARYASNLDWSDASLGKIYIGGLDENGSPQCAHKCYRSVDEFINGWSGSSGCETEPFDVSLWPTQGIGGGLSNYWGQQVDLDNMLEHLDDEQLEIVSHEMGHGFALPDFYQEPKPANFKPCLMDATTSSTRTAGCCAVCWGTRSTSTTPKAETAL